MIETASYAIVITDRERRLAFCNPAAGELFGMDCESVVGTPVSHLTPQEFRDDVARREASALDGEAQRYETVIERPDGERRIVSAKARERSLLSSCRWPQTRKQTNRPTLDVPSGPPRYRRMILVAGVASHTSERRARRGSNDQLLATFGVSTSPCSKYECGSRHMSQLQEHDAMICRSCGNEERASEGYPCSNCRTFICLICTFRGVTLCRKCSQQGGTDEA